jgi:hypothetical protein
MTYVVTEACINWAHHLRRGALPTRFAKGETSSSSTRRMYRLHAVRAGMPTEAIYGEDDAAGAAGVHCAECAPAKNGRRSLNARILARAEDSARLPAKRALLIEEP